METGFNFSDALEAYSLLGGVPRYLELLTQFNNSKDLQKRIFTPGSIFLPEGENILIQEFGAAWVTYFSILEVMAPGKFGPSSIANQLGMPVQMIPKYLENLEKMQLVRRKKPVLGVTRHVRYQIWDKFFQFWFNVCFPRIEQYRDGSATVPPERIFSTIGNSMERVVLEMLLQPGILPFSADAFGSWWDRSGHEIDVVMFTKKSKALLAGEVKWTNKPVSLKMVEQLLDNIKLIDWYNDSRQEFVFIVSRSGFSERAKQLMKLKNVLGLGIQELEDIILKNISPKWDKK
jgi:hypothetical protein